LRLVLLINYFTGIGTVRK